jgi:hypothetical protein
MEETYSKVSDDAALDSQKATARGVRDVRATLAVDEGVGSFFLRPEGRKVSKSTTHTPHTHAFRHQRHHNSSPPPRAHQHLCRLSAKSLLLEATGDGHCFLPISTPLSLSTVYPNPCQSVCDGAHTTGVHPNKVGRCAHTIAEHVCARVCRVAATSPRRS